MNDKSKDVWNTFLPSVNLTSANRRDDLPVSSYQSSFDREENLGISHLHRQHQCLESRFLSMSIGHQVYGSIWRCSNARPWTLPLILGNNLAIGARSCSHHACTGRLLKRRERFSGTYINTSSSIYHQKHFSTSPLIRHGHLDPPKPGEE